MRTFTLLVGLIFLTFSGAAAQAPNNSFVSFKNSNGVSGNNNQFFRSIEDSNEGRSWFRLSGSMGYSPILIGFIPGATDGYEDTYDGDFINEGGSIEFYSFCEAYKLEIQGRSELQTNQLIQVPLGYEVTSAGDYTVSIVLEYIDPTFEILLEDTLLNITTDLRALDYTFNVSIPTEDNNRFILHYDYSEQLSSESFSKASKSIKPYFWNDELNTFINSQILPINIQLFDVRGNEILNTNYKNRIQTNGLSSGIYIVKYTLENSKTISKKIIKKI